MVAIYYIIFGVEKRNIESDRCAQGVQILHNIWQKLTLLECLVALNKILLLLEASGVSIPSYRLFYFLLFSPPSKYFFELNFFFRIFMLSPVLECRSFPVCSH